MTVEEQLKIIKKAREEIANLDLERSKVYREVKEKINPEGPLENLLWDYVCNGVNCYLHDISDHLEVRQKWLDSDEE